MRSRVEPEPIEPGRHERVVRLGGTGARVAVTIVAGVRRGPRAVLAGGDGLGLAAARAALAPLDPAGLAGVVVVAPCLVPGGAGPLLAGAGFVLELRAGPAGWTTWPHLRADLSVEPVARLARAAGVELVVDARPRPSSLRASCAALGIPALLLEAGEEGRAAPGVGERAAAVFLSLLRAQRMLPGSAERPGWRATATTVVRVRGREAAWAVAAAPPGAVVEAGDPLCTLHDESGRARATITAPARGVVLAVPAAAGLARGEPVARLARLDTATRPPAPGPHALVCGWSEWLSLPDLGIARILGKIDTGARTSALHVLSMKHAGERGGHPVLELRLPVGRRPRSRHSVVVRAVVKEHVVVRDSGGHAERRPVIETTMVLGPLRRRVRVTLTDRGDMLFPLLVGRTALGEHVTVDASRRNLLGGGG